MARPAKEVAKLLLPHFVREEEVALPPLGLLAALGQGAIDPDMANVLRLTDKLEAELPDMLAERNEIVAALRHLVVAAEAEKKPEYARFAEELMLHARAEEEVTHPTAILVGRYVKLKLGK